ncbi:molybdopterin-dependent oxidoreductase [Blastococcus brunescens]|uniref:Molybdopterin-dependent oxidoreductase n=1 Tax=Blastococcus brunescens TaxID=1564165 RepID=A0ABZ1BC37_9ACTN|nr:molybdopterin-dependent oxidoreductase [Blastococcus sp. BMG 8361]WRL66970.1 molybdopterin-dependent oxidoreductase [Blastococcus sp. BMG 8361]
MPFPLSDIAEADVVVLVGSNPADTMPPAMQYFDAGRERGAQHVVVDPRRTATARNAALHLQPLPGTDLALANGLLHIALAEGWSTRSTSLIARPASTTSGPGSRATGPTGSSGSPASPWPTSGAPSSPSHGPSGPSC